MKCAVEVGIGALMYVASFIKIGSSIQKLIGTQKLSKYNAKHRNFHACAPIIIPT
jgi:hypothetical protein